MLDAFWIIVLAFILATAVVMVIAQSVRNTMDSMAFPMFKEGLSETEVATRLFHANKWMDPIVIHSWTRDSKRRFDKVYK